MAIISNGTTIADAGAFSASLGSMVLVKTVTISSSTSSVAMTSAIDDTYPVYKFEFINMHVSTNNTKLQIDFSTNNGSNFSVAKTTTLFNSFHNEADSQVFYQLEAAGDLVNSTSDQPLIWNNQSNVDDAAGCGEMWLFNPLSTTFLKQFMISYHGVGNPVAALTNHIGGYLAAGAAVNAFKLTMNSGTIDSGIVKCYGIKAS